MSDYLEETEQLFLLRGSHYCVHAVSPNDSLAAQLFGQKVLERVWLRLRRGCASITRPFSWG